MKNLVLFEIKRCLDQLHHHFYQLVFRERLALLLSIFYKMRQITIRHFHDDADSEEFFLGLLPNEYSLHLYYVRVRTFSHDFTKLHFLHIKLNLILIQIFYLLYSYFLSRAFLNTPEHTTTGSLSQKVSKFVFFFKLCLAWKLTICVL